MLKRIGSLLLSLALCITMIPMPTFAAEPTTVSSTPTGTALTQETFNSYTTETDILRKANGAWRIKTGNYYLEEISLWIVHYIFMAQK